MAPSSVMQQMTVLKIEIVVSERGLEACFVVFKK